MVESYLTAEISYSELGRKNNINNPSLIVRWVQDFYKKGLDGLREKAKGRVPKMLKNPTKPSKPEKISKKNRGNSSQEDYIKESEEKFAKKEGELLHAEIQNRYLKELRKLRLKRENINTMTKRESSTTSEDFTN